MDRPPFSWFRHATPPPRRRRRSRRQRHARRSRERSRIVMRFAVERLLIPDSGSRARTTRPREAPRQAAAPMALNQDQVLWRRLQRQPPPLVPQASTDCCKLSRARSNRTRRRMRMHAACRPNPIRLRPQQEARRLVQAGPALAGPGAGQDRRTRQISRPRGHMVKSQGGL